MTFPASMIIGALDDEPGALAELEAAYTTAQQARDESQVAALAGTAVLIICSSWGDLTPTRLWGTRVREASLPHENEVSQALFLAGWLHDHAIERAPADKERAQHFADQLARVLRSAIRRLPADIVVLASEPLLDFLAQAGESAAFDDIATLGEQALANADVRLASKHLFWRGNNLRILDLPEKAAACFESAAAIAARTQWYWIRLQLIRASLRPAIEGRDSARIDALLENNRQLLRPERPADWGDYHYLCGWDALLRNDGRGALLHCHQSIDNYRTASFPPQHMGIVQGAEAAALILLGRADEAVAAFGRVAAMDNERGRSVRIANVAFARAVHARQTDQSGYLDQLRSGFAAAAAFDLVQIFRALPKQMAELCADALQNDIEPAFVRKMILARRFAAPIDAGESWPWPLKVHTLGIFSLSIRDASLESSGKAQNKPLDLVRLLASNDGQALSVASVIAALWPDSEGEAGRKVFDATLARLKKLIGSEEWIVVAGGKLAIDETQVWIDAVELARVANRVDALALPDSSDAALQHLARSALALYRAAFLSQEPETPWLLEARERNKNRFVRTIERLGTDLERRGLVADAVRLFDRGTEIEPVAETFYRRLMLAYERQGDNAEAMRVYRRCRDMLSILLSIAPSRETRAIVERLYKADQAES